MAVDGVVRRSTSVALLVLLVVPVLLGTLVACGGGGGEAERAPDPDEEDSSDDEGGGAPGEDAGDDAAPGEDDGDGDDDEGEAGNGDGGDDAATAAQEAYVAYQAMFERLVITPDPDDPEIEERTSGAERDHVVEVLTTYDAGGLAVEFGTRHAHHVYDVSVDGDTATVLDCFVSDTRVVDEASRAVVRRDPEGGTPYVVTATVVRGDDGWTVSGQTAAPVEPPQGCGPDGPVRRGT